MNLVILPMKCEDEAILRRIEEDVSVVFPSLSTRLGPESGDLLEGCLDPTRGQHNASILLRRLSRQIGLLSADYLLGITAVDYCVPDMNFVFGLADPSMRTGLISLYRLKPEVSGDPPDRTLYESQAIKETVHELGHVFGLYHCHSLGCVMFFSNTVSDTDRKSRDFCPSCRKEIARFLSR